MSYLMQTSEVIFLRIKNHTYINWWGFVQEQQREHTEQRKPWQQSNYLAIT